MTSALAGSASSVGWRSATTCWRRSKLARMSRGSIGLTRQRRRPALGAAFGTVCFAAWEGIGSPPFGLFVGPGSGGAHRAPREERVMRKQGDVHVVYYKAPKVWRVEVTGTGTPPGATRQSRRKSTGPASLRPEPSPSWLCATRTARSVSAAPTDGTPFRRAASPSSLRPACAARNGSACGRAG